jgi:hypothetical protein
MFTAGFELQTLPKEIKCVVSRLNQLSHIGMYIFVLRFLINGGHLSLISIMHSDFSFLLTSFCIIRAFKCLCLHSLVFCVGSGFNRISILM